MNIFSKRIRKFLVFVLIVTVMTYIGVAFISNQMPQDAHERSSFIFLLLILAHLVLLIIFILTFRTVAPKYTYTFGREGVIVSVAKKGIKEGEEFHLDQRSHVAALLKGSLIDTLHLSKKMGNLNLAFHAIKGNSFFIDRDQMKYVLIQQGWYNWLTHTTSVFIVGKKGWIWLEYVGKKDASSLVSYLQQVDIPVKNNNKVYLRTPDLLP